MTRLARTAATVSPLRGPFLALALLVPALRAEAVPFVLAQTVLDPRPGRNDFFASALAAFGNDILAGARFDDAAGTDAGVAYLIDISSGVARRTFHSPTPAPGDQFGAAVASLGSLVLVGAPHVAEGAAAHAGAVYLFEGETGAYVETLYNPTPELGELFGFALGAAGARIAAGTPFYKGQAPGSGAAHIFDVQSGELIRSFRNPRPADYDLFGQAIAAVGGEFLVGAPLDDTAASQAGVAYLLDPEQRTPVRTFVSPNPHMGDQFGAAVAALGSRVLIGAPFDDTAAPDSGAVYLFDSTTGALLRTFVDPAANRDGRFGTAVAALGSAVLVGAPFADNTAVDAGVAYLFDADTGALLETIDNPTPAAGDQFGATLAVAGDALVIGAWLDDAAAPNAGALYVFRDNGSPATTTSTTAPPPTTTTTTTLLEITSTTSSTTSTSTTSTALPPPEDTTTTTASTTSVTVGTVTTSTVATTSTAVTTSTGTTTTEDQPAITSTSITATTSTAAVPSTIVPPDLPLGCDDGDPCTTDTVTPGGECDHVPLGALEAALCRLAQVEDLIHATPSRAFGGRRLSARFAREVALARRLVAAAGVAGRPGAAARVRRAGRALARFIAAARRAERTGRIVPAVAGPLVVLATDAAEELGRAGATP